ncbi:MAG: ComEC/Rec2 family competence protein, partial [Pseudomonadota bacterium]
MQTEHGKSPSPGADADAQEATDTPFAAPRVKPSFATAANGPIPFGSGLTLRIERGFHALGDRLQEEVEFGRHTLWAPVIFIAGIVTYFNLPREPYWPVVLAVFAIAGFTAFYRAHRGRAYGVVACVALFFGGLFAATVQTDRVLAPRLNAPVTASVSGLVERVETAKRGRVRITLSAIELDRPVGSPIPTLIRISARDPNALLRAGQRIEVRARLRPPAGPVMPGGYDFSLSAFYDGRGASGFAVGPIKVLDPDASDAMSIRLQEFRSAFGDRISQSLPGESGTIARALIVGDRQAIPDSAADDLRIAGLAHILAISGLHMALLTGAVFWCVRALLALSGLLANRYPIKKWASATAFLAGFAYLLVSGASVATERAFIMVSVALFAVLIDRPALTLRSLAVAAFLVAAFYPHTVIGPSFQMSFLATAALIGFAEWAARRQAERPPDGKWDKRRSFGMRLAETIRVYGLGLLTTSILAGAATGALAAYHFHTIAPLGVLGNLVAMPVVGLVVMPAGLLASVLIPFGLDPPAFGLMGWGIDRVLSIAAWIADLTAGTDHIGTISLATPILATIGILWAAIWRTSWRWAGVVLFVVGMAAAPFASRPDVLISENG